MIFIYPGHSPQLSYSKHEVDMAYSADSPNISYTIIIVNDHRRSENFRVLSFCVKVFLWSRIPTEFFDGVKKIVPRFSDLEQDYAH